MAKSLVWRDLSMRQVYDYQSLRTPQESLRYLRGIFQLDNSERSAIILDLYYYTLSFAKDHDFSPDQTSAFFSILKETHSNAVASPLINLEKDFAFFKNILLQHSIQRPPISEKVFSFAEMKLITDYVTHTYFRHYMMYKYAFTKKLRLDFVIENFMPTQGTSAVGAGHHETAHDAAVMGDGNNGTSGGTNGGMVTSEGVVGTGASATAASAALGTSNSGAGSNAGSGVSATAAATSGDASGVAGDGRPTQADGPAANSSDDRTQAANATTLASQHQQQQLQTQSQQQSSQQGLQSAQHQSQQQGAASLVTKDPSKSSGEDTVSDKSAGSALTGEAPKPQGNKRDAAITEVRTFISTVLASKLDEIRNTLQSKLVAQDEIIGSKLRKIEGVQDDDKDKKKDAKAKPKK